MFKTLLLLPLFLAASVLAARPVTVQILVDQTMYGSTPGSERLVQETVLNAAVRLVPGVDVLRLGLICGQPQTVYDAQVNRDLRPVATVVKAQLLAACTRPGSPLNAGLLWFQGQQAGGLVLLSDAETANDNAASQLAATAGRLQTPFIVLGARAEVRDAFDRLMRGNPNYLGTYSAADAPAGLRLLLKKLRR